MCKAIADMIEEGREEGLEQGLEQGLIRGIIKICQKYGVSQEITIQQIQEECPISDEKITYYLQQYWI